MTASVRPSAPAGGPLLRVLSRGAGVASTTLALMAAHNEISPIPDCTISPDTGWEPRAVYEHLKRLREALPFPVHVVSAGNIRSDALAKVNTTEQRFAAIPWFVRLPRGNDGISRRQCTKEYKLEPIRRKASELIDGKRGHGAVEMGIGISLDEAPPHPARNAGQIDCGRGDRRPPDSRPPCDEAESWLRTPLWRPRATLSNTGSCARCRRPAAAGALGAHPRLKRWLHPLPPLAIDVRSR